MAESPVAAVRRLMHAAHLDMDAPYQHYRHIDQPLWTQRILFELLYALRVSEQAGGRYDPLIAEAASRLEAALQAEGAFTRQAALQAEEALSPMADRAKAYTVHLVAHAHIDMNWQWPFHETVAVTLETFRTMLDLMDEDPDFTFAQSQASCYRIVEEYEPAMLERIRRRVAEGRWEVSASTWVEADKNMPNAESMVRHLLYTKQYLSRLLGLDPATLNLDYEPDTFGHAWSVPEILRAGGVTRYYHCRGYDGHAVYRWRAPSGRELLCYREPTWYLGDMNPGFAQYVPGFCAGHGLRDALKVYGVGDHGGGPTRRDLAYIREMMSWPIFPTLRFSSYRAFFDQLEKIYPQLPVVDQELNCVFTGCYTTQSRIKLSNRVGEAALYRAEALSVAAKALTGRPYEAPVFAKAWEQLLFNQFHDILTGSGVRDTREYALAQFSRCMAAAGTQYAGAMRALAAAVDSSGIVEKGDRCYSYAEGAGVGYGSMRYLPPVSVRGGAITRLFHLFNPLAFDREENATLTLWDWQGDRQLLCVRDGQGRPLDFQLLRDGVDQGYMGHRYLELLVRCPVPALGWATVVVDEAEPALRPLPLPKDPRVHHPDRYALENEFLRAEFDVSSGQLTSLFDKELNQERLAPGAGAGFYYIEEDSDKGQTSWVVGRYLLRQPVEGNVRLRPGEAGPLRQSLRLSFEFGRRASTLEAEISLDRGARALRLEASCLFHEYGQRGGVMPQLAFAACVHGGFDRALYDIPAGCIRRPQQGLDVPACSYAAAPLAQGALLLASDSKYGFRADQNALQLTLIRAGFDPDPYPERGEHRFSLFLGSSPSASPKALADEVQALCQPLSSLAVRPGKGSLPLQGSFLRLEGEDLRLSALKASEDGQSLVVRLYNLAGQAREAGLRFALPVESACLSDNCERHGAPLPLQEGAVAVRLEPNALCTLLVRLHP